MRHGGVVGAAVEDPLGYRAIRVTLPDKDVRGIVTGNPDDDAACVNVGVLLGVVVGNLDPLFRLHGRCSSGRVGRSGSRRACSRRFSAE